MTVYRHKTTCSAFGCQRYTRRIDSPNGIYLCPAHWRMVPKRLRWLFNKAYRRAEKFGWTQKDGRRVRRVWDKCVAAANRNVGMP